MTREDTTKTPNTVVSARRSIPGKLDRARWSKCPDCGPENKIWRYCPFCGRPKTEEAWRELEGRIADG